MNTQITEDYVSFETAKLLKEKGFDDEYTNAFYDNNGNLYFIDLLSDFSEHPDNDTDIAASTLYVAMKWLREVHNKYIEICTDKAYNFKDVVFRPAIYDKELDCLWESDNFLVYEEACEAAIKHCLTNFI